MHVWTRLSDDDIYDVASEVGVTIALAQSRVHGRPPIYTKGRARIFTLKPDPSTRDENGNYSYQRTSVGFREGRRVHAVCWHGHRDFMRGIFRRDPDARIKTSWDDWRGQQDFEDRMGATAWRNIGSMMYPTFAKDACLCNDTIQGSYAVSMSQGMIGGCPFVIFNPEHYRADGSCKCDDAAHREFMKREWEYTDADFEGIPLREGV